MSWLTDLTNWLREQFLTLWNALKDFLGDLLLNWLEMVCDFWATAVESITPPEFLTTYSLDTLLGNAGPSIAWLSATFKLPEAMAILAAGWAFRLLRKLFTLGQW